MDIPFESFSRLIYRLGHPPSPRSAEESPFTPSEIFTSWLNHLPRPLPAGSGKHLFRILFPHGGARRRYGLRETKLAYELQNLLGLKGLTKWDSAGGEGDGSGCLGIEVEKLMRGRANDGLSQLNLAQLDLYLDDLAAHSPFSQLDQRPGKLPPQATTLSKLFKESNLSPYAIGLLVQIILQDIRPYLDPLPSLAIRNPTSMLRKKSTEGPHQLDLLSAMKAWDPRMADLYVDGKGDIDWCADMTEAMQRWDGNSPMDVEACVAAGPVLGVNVQIPKCLKGRSVEAALDAFCGTKHGPPAATIWAETKYDGYRMQIHVEVKADDDVKITVFSKSKRNATLDRINTHSIILAALDFSIHPALPQHPALTNRLLSRLATQSSRVKHSVILEAEVIPYNEGQREGGRGPGIEEFWWLGPAGVTGNEEDVFLDQTVPTDPRRHLCLVFFDILHLDGKSLLLESYENRRSLLEGVLLPVQGFAFCCERTAISLNHGRAGALLALRDVFIRSNEARQEGLVLKACDSTYLDNRWRWVKLKKDYIPNLGDCIDLVILGAGWDVDRARELRVDTSVLITFYIGVLTNHDRVVARVETPHFEILFKASYGLERDALEMVNDKIRHGRWRTKPYDKDDPFKRRLIGLSWTYRMPRGMKPPSVLFEHPLCAEVMGAGFLKLPASRLYELRFPRIQKVFEPAERSYAEALTSSGLISAAHQSLGYNPTSSNPNPSPQDDSLRALWRSTSAVSLVDIPDFPTPSPERPSARRMQSAPQLSTFKTSPSTPISSARPHRSPTGLIDQTAAQRLASAVAGPSHPTSNTLGIGEEEGVLWPTPVTSPVRGKRLGSPLTSPRSKRAKYRSQPPLLGQPYTPPPTSPIASPSKPTQPGSSHPFDDHSLLSRRTVLQRLESNTPPKKRLKATKALSLRSRLRRAVKISP